MRNLIPRIAVGLLALQLSIWPAVVSANVGPAESIHEGQPTAEPYGLQEIDIRHETLKIDLRPLAEAKPARITATYHLFHHGDEQTIDLLFVGGPMADQMGEVRLDGRPIKTRGKVLEQLPESWQIPGKTSNLAGAEPLDYHVTTPNQGLLFTLNMQAGAHILEVTYRAQATAIAHMSEPVVSWQLAYILAPARDWRSFGELDVVVDLPDGWSAAASPQLERIDNKLTGHFDRLPADALTLTVQSPTLHPNALMVAKRVGPLVMFLLALVLIIMCGRSLGCWLGKRRRTSLWAIPFSAVIAIGCFVGVLCGMWLYCRIQVLLAASPNQASWYIGTNSAYSVLALGVLMVPLGFVVAQVSVFGASWRARKMPTTDITSK
jgi:hypothetical protein